LRMPVTFAVQPGTGRMFINDVGENTWEEINEALAGSNYGWPNVEGIANNPSYRDPIYAYGHGSGNTVGCSITGGTFYNPASNQFPVSYTGKYFFSDFCNGWINVLDPQNGTASVFATKLEFPLALAVGPDGSLYYLQYGGSVYKISYSAPQGQAAGPRKAYRR